MDGDDYQIDDLRCPCGCPNTHSRHCADCDDGFIDEHDDDPINFAPGEEVRECPDCFATGIQRWCPQCGRDWWTWPEAERKACNPDDDALSAHQSNTGSTKHAG